MSAVEKTLEKIAKKETLPLYSVQSPFELVVEYQSAASADKAEMIPGAERLDGRRVKLVHNDYKVIFQALEVFYFLI